MGLKEMIANKKLKGALENLYLDVESSFVEYVDRVNRNKLSKEAAIPMLEAICESGEERYNRYKESNPNATDIFVENDKRFTVLFKGIKRHIDDYNSNLTV